MTLKVKVGYEYRVTDIERDNTIPDWIEKHKQQNQQKLPPLPEFLIPLVNIHSDGMASREGRGGWKTYIKGQPITKDFIVIPCSGQQWQRMTASERAQLLELVEWTGGNADDYVRSFEIMYPFSPDFSKRKKK